VNHLQPGPGLPGRCWHWPRFATGAADDSGARGSGSREVWGTDDSVSDPGIQGLVEPNASFRVPGIRHEAAFNPGYEGGGARRVGRATPRTEATSGEYLQNGWDGFVPSRAVRRAMA